MQIQVFQEIVTWEETMFPKNDEKTGLLSKGSNLFILSLFCQLEAEYFISTHRCKIKMQQQFIHWD